MATKRNFQQELDSLNEEYNKAVAYIKANDPTYYSGLREVGKKIEQLLDDFYRSYRNDVKSVDVNIPKQCDDILKDIRIMTGWVF